MGASRHQRQLGPAYSNPAPGESVSQYQTYLQNITSAILAWGAKAVILMGPRPFIGSISANHTTNGVSLLAQYFQRSAKHRGRLT